MENLRLNRPLVATQHKGNFTSDSPLSPWIMFLEHVTAIEESSLTKKILPWEFQGKKSFWDLCTPKTW